MSEKTIYNTLRNNRHRAEDIVNDNGATYSRNGDVINWSLPSSIDIDNLPDTTKAALSDPLSGRETWERYVTHENLILRENNLSIGNPREKIQVIDHSLGLISTVISPRENSIPLFSNPDNRGDWMNNYKSIQTNNNWETEFQSKAPRLWDAWSPKFEEGLAKSKTKPTELEKSQMKAAYFMMRLHEKRQKITLDDDKVIQKSENGDNIGWMLDIGMRPDSAQPLGQGRDGFIGVNMYSQRYHANSLRWNEYLKLREASLDPSNTNYEMSKAQADAKLNEYRKERDFLSTEAMKFQKGTEGLGKSRDGSQIKDPRRFVNVTAAELNTDVSNVLSALSKGNFNDDFAHYRLFQDLTDKYGEKWLMRNFKNLSTMEGLPKSKMVLLLEMHQQMTNGRDVDGRGAQNFGKIAKLMSTNMEGITIHTADITAIDAKMGSNPDAYKLWQYNIALNNKHDGIFTKTGGSVRNPTGFNDGVGWVIDSLAYQKIAEVRAEGKEDNAYMFKDGTIDVADVYEWALGEASRLLLSNVGLIVGKDGNTPLIVHSFDHYNRVHPGRPYTAEDAQMVEQSFDWFLKDLISNDQEISMAGNDLETPFMSLTDGKYTFNYNTFELEYAANVLFPRMAHEGERRVGSRGIEDFNVWSSKNPNKAIARPIHSVNIPPNATAGRINDMIVKANESFKYGNIKGIVRRNVQGGQNVLEFYNLPDGLHGALTDIDHQGKPYKPDESMFSFGLGSDEERNAILDKFIKDPKFRKSALLYTMGWEWVASDYLGPAPNFGDISSRQAIVASDQLQEQIRQNPELASKAVDHIRGLDIHAGVNQLYTNEVTLESGSTPETYNIVYQGVGTKSKFHGQDSLIKGKDKLYDRHEWGKNYFSLPDHWYGHDSVNVSYDSSAAPNTKPFFDAPDEIDGATIYSLFMTNRLTNDALYWWGQGRGLRKVFNLGPINPKGDVKIEKQTDRKKSTLSDYRAQRLRE